MGLLRTLFDRDLLMSGIAMVRDIPRALRLKQVDGSLFFTEEKRREYRQPIESVTPQSPRPWDTMEVDQMLHHLMRTSRIGCQRVILRTDDRYVGRWIARVDSARAEDRTRA